MLSESNKENWIIQLSDVTDEEIDNVMENMGDRMATLIQTLKYILPQLLCF